VQGKLFRNARPAFGWEKKRKTPREGRKMTADNNKRCAIVIIGASGDLAKRKLVPALNALYTSGQLDGSTVIVGSGRTFFTDAEFRNRFTVSPDFAGRLFYHQYSNGLKKYLLEKGAFSKVIFFLAQPPEAYTATACELKSDGFGSESSLIIEKPFGYDFASAKKLNRELSTCFSDAQIFRIDHYLAKEAVQNILVFRFANTLFSPIWNSTYIESIQISAHEEAGIMERGAYFDKAGIIRDMVQNHLLQIASLIAMEPPASLAPRDICCRKVELLRAVSVSSCRRFQYNGYREEKNVAAASATETYAELTLAVNNPRWTGMPVHIRVGKATHRKGTEVGIRLKPLPQSLFNEKGDLAPNRIIFKIQPSEGIILDLSSKLPGTDAAIADTHMNFCYRESFDGNIPDAYLRLLQDAIRGDRTLFVSAEETETAWKVLDGVLDKGDLGFYDRGSLPSGTSKVDWIDFEKYQSFCT
jgi:glucose-6-phosphate 1-dehydrogenase